MDRDTAKILLKIKAVTLRTDPPFKWTSGILAPIYCDNRLLMSYTEERKKIVKKFLKIIKKNNIKADVIGGIATSGIPWASWIAEELKLPLIYIRGKQKGHGKENLIEGKLEKGNKVLIIEDLISTGGSSLRGVQAARNAGAKVDNCLAIFSYEMEISKDSFHKNKVNLYNLTDITTLSKVALKEGYINKQQQKQIIDWRNDPQGWKV